jgi:hypothetical protein
MYAPPVLTAEAATESPYRAAPDTEGPPVVDDTLFPAGGAVFFLALGFFATRVFIGLANDRLWLGRAGAFAAVMGALLALAAVVRVTYEATVLRRRWAAFAGRALALAPIIALAFAAMLSASLSQRLQLAALTGLLATVLIAGFRAVAVSLLRRRWIAAVTVLTLVAGEAIELFLPVVSFASVPDAALARAATTLGRVSEACAFGGIGLALVWSMRATVAAVGTARAWAFLAMPAAFTAMILTLPARLPRTTESVARAAFGARFDLAGVSGAGHPSRGALMVYTLLFSGLVAAASVSLASQGNDRGGGARRALAWTSLLLAGFGAVGLAGPVDPLRAVALTLGVVLLEQAVEHE